MEVTNGLNNKMDKTAFLWGQSRWIYVHSCELFALHNFSKTSERCACSCTMNCLHRECPVWKVCMLTLMLPVVRMDGLLTLVERTTRSPGLHAFTTKRTSGDAGVSGGRPVVPCTQRHRKKRDVGGGSGPSYPATQKEKRWRGPVFEYGDSSFS